MLLSSVPPYDATAVDRHGSHAVVVGGSMAGLLSARVLADGYDRVTVLERDSLPTPTEPRRGVPQSTHVHVMMEPARVVLNDLFSGYQEAVRSEGGLVLDIGRKLNFHDRGGFLARPDTELPMPCASRPLFEAVVRRRIAATKSVTVREECHFTDYLTDESATAVEGVAFRSESGGEETLSADLVVDATGRTSRTPQWLTDHGYEAPPTEEVSVDLAYGTVLIERPPERNDPYLFSPSPPRKKGGVAIPIEGDRWIVTLFGLHGDHPPTDHEGYIGFADALDSPQLAELLTEQDWISDEVDYYPFPASRRRRYETLTDFPDGLVVTGDAVASFNPIYGQGMSAAALDALQLHHTLAAGEHAVASRFFERIEAHLDVIWQTAVGADFEFEGTEGPKPRGTDLFNRYLSRLVRTAHEDGAVSEAFLRVMRLEKAPMSLLRPGIAARVFLPL